MEQGWPIGGIRAELTQEGTTETAGVRSEGQANDISLDVPSSNSVPSHLSV